MAKDILFSETARARIRQLPHVTDAGLTVPVTSHAYDASTRPPVGVVSVTVQERPTGMSAIVTGASVVRVENDPVYPVPQS